MAESTHGSMKPNQTFGSAPNTYTQVARGSAADYTSKPQRLSLRARLEREREEREKRRQASFINTFRNLFGTPRR